jgi:hypothetical protein
MTSETDNNRDFVSSRCSCAGNLTFGSLFAGIGGFDLGFERAGMECKWQVEIDEYATKILEQDWPHVKRERDVRECGRHNLSQVDVMAIHAKKTVTPVKAMSDASSRALAMSSSELLMSFALALLSEKTQAESEPMLPGLGNDSEWSWRKWVTQFCHSDSEPVVLGLTTDGKGCSCLVTLPTPCKRDYKGMSSKKWRERTPAEARKSGCKSWATLPDAIGGTPHPEFLEAVMGFPIGHTELRHSETQ